MQKVQIRKILPLIIALAFGVWAVILGDAYVKNERKKLQAEFERRLREFQPPQPPPVMGIVVVAAKDIPPQVPITHTDLGIAQMPVDYIQPQAVTNLDDVIGQISHVPIMAKEQILKTKLLPPGKIGKSLSEITPEGKRAITVSVDSIASGVNLIRPGDFVDVFALISLPKKPDEPSGKDSGPRLISLFQNIEVLAVGSEFVDIRDAGQARKEQAKISTGSSTVTLALSPQEAVLLSFVQENGKIKLVLRAQEDTKTQPIRSAGWDELLQYLSTGKEVEMVGKRPVVEIYRGVNKETLPLSEAQK